MKDKDFGHLGKNWYLEASADLLSLNQGAPRRGPVGRYGERLGLMGKDKFEATCKVVCEKRGWSLTEHQIDVPTEGSRKQIVYFNFFNYETREMVKFHTVIGSTARIRPERLIFALELNFRLPHGCLAVNKENLVMVDTLILEEVDSVELESAVDFLAKTGDQYEAALFARDEH